MPTTTPGTLRYLAPTVAPSLHRNGQVVTRRDRDGSDSGFQGLDFTKVDVPVHDARSLSPGTRPTLAHTGFELLSAALTSTTLDFLDHTHVIRDYYPDCADLVRNATGATHVFPFDHNVRSAGGKKSRQRIEGGQQVQAPAHMVHGDYTLTSGPQRLRDLGRPPSANDTLRPFLEAGQPLIPQALVDHALGPDGRFAIINVWRNIDEEPVATHPIAFCDAQSVEPGDLVVFEIHYEDRIGENYFARHDERHRWSFYPQITRDEAILIKQWDSAGTLARTEGGQGDAADPAAPCTFSFHSAFVDPSTPPDAPDRWSIEVRCAVLYD